MILQKSQNGKKSPSQVFSAISLESCTEASHFDRMDHIEGES